MTTKQLWYLLIEGQIDSETGAYGNFYAYGDHLGDALNNVINASKDHSFFSQNLLEASFLENFGVIGHNHELMEISKGVYMREAIHTFPFNDPQTVFIPPIGIVKSAYDGQYEYDLIKEKFVAYEADKNGFFEFELVLAKQNLIATFLKAIEYLPIVDAFWIYIKEYWESEMTELWVAKHFTNKQIVIDFLTSQQKNTLENGYLSIVVHSLIGATNLTLDDHKKIYLHTNDQAVFNDFIGKIVDLGYQQTTDLYNLEFGYYHFHYRQADSLTRKEFIKMLINNKFELLDKWKD